MAGEIIKRRYYVLTPLSFLLGALVLIATLLLALSSYLRSVDKTIAGYEHMLGSIEATLIHEMVLANQRQLAVLEASLDKVAIARGESAINPIWAIAHQFKHDAHYLYFYNARINRVDSYPARSAPPSYQPKTRPWYQALATDSDKLIWFGPYQDYDSTNQALTLIKRVEDGEGLLLGLLMVDMSFGSLQAALCRALGDEQAAIHITERHTGQLVVGHNQQLLPTAGPEAGYGTSGLDVIRHGSHLRLALADIGWDLNLYLPPSRFHDSLRETLLMVMLPALALLGIWLCSLMFLVRIFRQEQALIQGSLNDIRQSTDPMAIPHRQHTWFVHGSLGEIDQVRTHLLQGQDALLQDPLTGIMNRRAFDQDSIRLEQDETPHWLLLFDVDNFKRINDSWGHGVGDAVLRRVATILARSFGSTQVYRIGGDEFAALLPWDSQDIGPSLDHLLTRVRELKWREFKEPITLSAGGARYPDAGDSLFEQTDACLYQSKRRGRDCWHLWSGKGETGSVAALS
ncbi:diguanylate cyclase domain-containing protein [Aeromonas eucrenophila]|uniref:diguanylate cyclase n=1 Tax=Aeromonas eucrenophila TaxID=649 RepID=A0ABW0Y9U5_9GAMM|nr:diguanylate cyclase [Aeromonas eucrenophila]